MQVSKDPIGTKGARAHLAHLHPRPAPGVHAHRRPRGHQPPHRQREGAPPPARHRRAAAPARHRLHRAHRRRERAPGEARGRHPLPHRGVERDRSQVREGRTAPGCCTPTSTSSCAPRATSSPRTSRSSSSTTATSTSGCRASWRRRTRRSRTAWCSTTARSRSSTPTASRRRSSAPPRARCGSSRGGYLIIDQAEALTAIDVNSGRYVGKKNLEDTITKINVEAAKEIVYQLRLRNIGGIIICDFIDMEKQQNRDKVFKALQEALGRDKAKTNVLRISELGLVEMTRKRVRESIGRVLHEDCGYCDGPGLREDGHHRGLRDLPRAAPLGARLQGPDAGRAVPDRGRQPAPGRGARGAAPPDGSLQQVDPGAARSRTTTASSTTSTRGPSQAWRSRSRRRPSTYDPTTYSGARRPGTPGGPLRARRRRWRAERGGRARTSGDRGDARSRRRDGGEVATVTAVAATATGDRSRGEALRQTGARAPPSPSQPAAPEGQD